MALESLLTSKFQLMYLKQLQCGLCAGSKKSQSPVLSDSSSQVPFVKVVNFLLFEKGHTLPIMQVFIKISSVSAN